MFEKETSERTICPFYLITQNDPTELKKQTKLLTPLQLKN